MENGNKYEDYYTIYWAFTQLCNDKCDHCYNNSGPQGKRISEEDCMAIIGNLPNKLQHIILSGGEPLADKKLLYAILERLQEKYDDKLHVTLQFNGDLLKPEILDLLIEKGVKQFSIASIDRYHKKQGERKETLSELFESRGIKFMGRNDNLDKKGRDTLKKSDLIYGFFGATEDMWLGGNWARGRALKKGIWKKDGTHNFCNIHSGGRGFLDRQDENIIQELSIQLWAINPCCPGTIEAMGDARKEKVTDVLQRMSKHEVMRKINQGDAYGMGESLGIDAKEGLQRAIELGNVCLWCDEFFSKHYDMKTQQPKKKIEQES
jgi:organic radical activating enzyme